jgi:hypothetical protein
MVAIIFVPNQYFFEQLQTFKPSAGCNACLNIFFTFFFWGLSAYLIIPCQVFIELILSDSVRQSSGSILGLAWGPCTILLQLNHSYVSKIILLSQPIKK